MTTVPLALYQSLALTSDEQLSRMARDAEEFAKDDPEQSVRAELYRRMLDARQAYVPCAIVSCPLRATHKVRVITETTESTSFRCAYHAKERRESVAIAVATVVAQEIGK